MNNRSERYRRYIFLGITIIALGITISVNIKDVVGSLGTVFIALGGIFFIIGMSIKKNEKDAKDK